MNRIRISIAVTLTLLLTGISIPMTSAATKPKAAGRTSSSIPNTILNGKGLPLSTLGIDGDFYIDTRSLLIYGPKKSKKWPLPQSLQGPVGVSGTDGKNGNEGKTISTASTVAGPSGAQGTSGEKGERGETGTAGANGAAGSAGAKGDTGSTGSTGPTGPTGSSGGGGGTPGATGATGAMGETGTAGSTGPSNVYLNDLTTWTLSTATARTSSTSPYLSKFLAGKSYVYTIYISGTCDASNGVFEIDVIHEDGSSATFNYVATSRSNFASEATYNVYTFLVTGVITPKALDMGIAIKVIDDRASTNGKPLTLSGRMFATLVGSIGTL